MTLSTSSISFTYARESVVYDMRMDATHLRSFRPLRAPRRFIAPQSSLRHETTFEVIELVDDTETPCSQPATTIASTSRIPMREDLVAEELWTRAARKRTKDLWAVKRHEARLLAWQQGLIDQVETDYEAYGGYLDPAQFDSDCGRIITCSERLEQCRVSHLKAIQRESNELYALDDNPLSSSRTIAPDMRPPTLKKWREFTPAYCWDYNGYVEMNGILDHLQVRRDLLMDDRLSSLHNLYLVHAKQEFLSHDSRKNKGGDSESASDGDDTTLSGSVPSTPESGSDGLKLPDEGRNDLAGDWRDEESREEDEDDDEYIPIIIEREEVTKSQAHQDEAKGEALAYYR